MVIKRSDSQAKRVGSLSGGEVGHGGGLCGEAATQRYRHVPRVILAATSLVGVVPALLHYPNHTTNGWRL